MKDRSDIVQSFLTIANRYRKQVILYLGLKPYTYGCLLERYFYIREKVSENHSGDVLAVSFSNCMDTVLYYIAAVEAGKDYLLLSPILDKDERTEMQKLLRMQGNMPFHGVTQVSMEKCENHADTGEVIFQTSGTSGMKKFVRISHEDFFSQMMIRYEYDSLNENGVKLLLVPVWKQLGMKELLRSLLFREKICIPVDFGMDSVMECLENHVITTLILKSSVLSGILYHNEFKKSYLEHVEILRYCQEPLQMETLIQMQSLFPGVQFYSDYGLTETIGTIAIMGPSIHKNAGHGHYLPTAGNFLPEIEIKLVDQDGREVSAGEVGELMVHSPQQFLGYLGGEISEYWVTTGDMGWLDQDGFFNLSGFRKTPDQDVKGELFILPAVARKQYVSVPVAEQLMRTGSGVAELFQTLLVLIHASLNVDEIKHFYLDMIPGIIDADAYGFELFPLASEKNGWMKPADQSWYQDALGLTSSHDIILTDKIYNKKLSLNTLESYYGGPVEILYLPLYSQKAQMHGVISFARSVKKGKFSSQEITVLKQISHHLNLALLNARIFQEIQTRQVMLQNTMNLSDVGTILSDLANTIYYMNSAVKNMIATEDVSVLRNSSLLEHVKENIYYLSVSGESEYSSQFACYFKKNQLPVMLKIRSVKLADDDRYVASFISQNLENEDMQFGDLSKDLSPKEQEVLVHLCQGLSYKDIAKKMCVSINTINFHIKNIYRKMNVNSRNELLNHVLYLGKNGFQFSAGELEQ